MAPAPAIASDGARDLARGGSISIAGLTKRFGTLAAVDAVDVEVRAGEFLSLLGPSGCGKTTLLMMIAGFETPGAGSIRLGTRDLTHVPPNRRGIGMVFQRYALFPHMSVAQNVAFPLKMRGVPRHDIGPRVERALVRLEGYGARLPAQLSGGQQQRVAVARALVFEPPVLLMDEPLGALDKKLREELQIEIKKLHDDVGVTILYVTHDQEEALTMSDRIAVMNRGRIEQIGAPTELYHRPGSSFVADFIGRMNFIDAVVVESKGGGFGLKVGTSILEVSTGRASATAAIRPGLPVRIAARPEQIALEAPADAAPDALPGRVDAAVFVGSHSTVIVTLEGGSSVQVSVPGDRSHTLPARGERVALRLDPTALHVFPAA